MQDNPIISYLPKYVGVLPLDGLRTLHFLSFHKKKWTSSERMKPMRAALVVWFLYSVYMQIYTWSVHVELKRELNMRGFQLI